MPIGKATNLLLIQSENGIRAKVPSNLKSAFDRVIEAGLTVMYSPEISSRRHAFIEQSKDQAKDAGEGAERLIKNLYAQSNKTMPEDVIVPCAMIFAFEYLDLVEKTGKAQITPDLVGKATMITSQSVLQGMYGITKDHLEQIMRQHQAGQPVTLPGAPPAKVGILSRAGA